jgi:hypothetical protein
VFNKNCISNNNKTSGETQNILLPGGTMDEACVPVMILAEQKRSASSEHPQPGPRPIISTTAFSMHDEYAPVKIFAEERRISFQRQTGDRSLGGQQSSRNILSDIQQQQDLENRGDEDSDPSSTTDHNVLEASSEHPQPGPRPMISTTAFSMHDEYAPVKIFAEERRISFQRQIGGRSLGHLMNSSRNILSDIQQQQDLENRGEEDSDPSSPTDHDVLEAPSLAKISDDSAVSPCDRTSGNLQQDPLQSRIANKLRFIYRRLLRHKTLTIIQFILVVYINIVTFVDIGPPGGFRDSETGLLTDQSSEERTEQGLILVNGTERAIVGANIFQLICIGFARTSAFSMYPGKLKTESRRRFHDGLVVFPQISHFVLYGPIHIVLCLQRSSWFTSANFEPPPASWLAHPYPCLCKVTYTSSTSIADGPS